MKIFSVFLIGSYLLIKVSSTQVNISNMEVHHDVNGNVMDIHDGNIIQYDQDGLYYYYGMGYQDCELESSIIPPQDCPGIYKSFGTSCGFRDDHALRIYSSPNLVDWTLESENSLNTETRPYGIYFRPKVIRNQDGLYILWINYLSNASTPLAAYPNATYLIASSLSPIGPFDSILTLKADITLKGAGDFDIMIDQKTQIGYIAYDAWENNHMVVIEQLNDDYTNSIGMITDSLSPPKHEAPMLFQRNEYYFLIYGHTCCFCHEGAGAEVLYALNPLGPWNVLYNNTELNPKVKPFTQRGTFLDHIIKGQNSFIIQVKNSNMTIDYIFVNDKWTSSVDGLKSHDLQYWQPLQFDDGLSPPSIMPLSYQDSFLLDLP